MLIANNRDQLGNPTLGNRVEASFLQTLKDNGIKVFIPVEGLTGSSTECKVNALPILHGQVKCAVPHEECRRGAHLPVLGREPVGG